MINPSLDKLLKHAENRYTLAIMGAKRARQLLEERHAEDEHATKTVTMAFEEIVGGKTKCVEEAKMTEINYGT